METGRKDGDSVAYLVLAEHGVSLVIIRMDHLEFLTLIHLELGKGEIGLEAMLITIRSSCRSVACCQTRNCLGRFHSGFNWKCISLFRCNSLNTCAKFPLELSFLFGWLLQFVSSCLCCFILFNYVICCLFAISYLCGLIM